MHLRVIGNGLPVQIALSSGEANGAPIPGIQGYDESDVRRPASATRRFQALDAASAMAS